MTSFTKIIFRFLPLGIVLLIAVVYYLSNDYKNINAEESTVELQVFRHRRAINPTALRYCKFNQYYDQEEGRCLGVPGGGKVLHVENGRSCGVNILKPHCTSLLYYHICKRDKSILAQCANGQIFDNRLQRCAYYDSSKLTPSIIQPDDLEYYEHVKVPDCMRPGRFPVPDHCSMFYTCDTNGHRLHQSVFKCPRNTGYQAIREICAVVSDCENNDSVDSVICVPDAPDDNVESLNSDGATEENEGISKNSETDSLTREESIQPKSYDDIISAPESITDNPLSIDNGGNDGDLDKASSLPTHPNQDISVSDGEMFNQASNPTESAQEINNEKADTIPPVDLPSMYSTDINSNIDSETTEQYKNNDDERVTLPNSNTEAFDSASTISNTPDLSSINDKSLKVDEETQDMTEAVNSYQTSTISNIPEFPPISGTSSKSYEEMQSVTTEQYGNDDGIMAPSNSNAEMVDQNPTPILSDISATTDSPSNDFDTLSPTSASAILSPQTDINDDQYATKELFKTSPSIDSKLIDPDLDAPEVIEDGSKHIDTLDLAPTTQPTLTLEHLTASMDITTITPTKQDLPAISDTDLITQNGKDSTEASPFIEQDAPITNN
ncbi:mucin-3A-like [Nylanderia fulva]|uniref:mucin-3A-like n=1 Tax=Nylanderia fulva TaxID=613905 RepID=UPI0010FB834B|nr:mucin-3A-like [Nylanderia fulva]